MITFLFNRNIIREITFLVNWNIISEILNIIIIIIKNKKIFLLMSSSCFFMFRLSFSWLAKMEFDNLTLIVANKSVRAWNSSTEPLSDDSTSTIKFLYNSVRKFFTRLSFPTKNNRRAARNRADTTTFDFVQKDFAKSSSGFYFSPWIPRGISLLGTKRCPSVYGNLPFM